MRSVEGCALAIEANKKRLQLIHFRVHALLPRVGPAVVLAEEDLFLGFPYRFFMGIFRLEFCEGEGSIDSHSESPRSSGVVDDENDSIVYVSCILVDVLLSTIAHGGILLLHSESEKPRGEDDAGAPRTLLEENEEVMISRRVVEAQERLNLPTIHSRSRNRLFHSP